MDMDIENHLLQQVRSGDADVISRIYELYFAAIYKFIRMQITDVQVAEDLASNVFFKLIDAVHHRKGPQRHLRGWLYQVARHEIYRYFAKERRNPMITLDEWLSTSSEITLEAQVVRTGEIERIQSAFQMLAREQQEVIILRFVEVLSLEETACVMKKSIGAIKSLQFRAIETLRKLLQDGTGQIYA